MARSVLDTYIIGIVLGVFGGHHFYLKRPFFGKLYAFTFGLFGIGYVFDLVRMRWLVHQANHKPGKYMRSDVYLLCAVLGPFGIHHLYLKNYRLAIFYACTFGVFGFGWIGDLFRVRSLISEAGSKQRSVGTARILALSPFGLFGAHHYYLQSYKLASFYTCTVGVFGIGWLVDQFRIPDLVKAANGPPQNNGRTEWTARILWASPFGFLGAHHFYLNRPLLGAVYLLTLGWFGIGWLYDMSRLPILYKRYKENDKHLYIDDAYMLLFPFGIFGLHHFYLKRNKWGIGYVFSCGAAGIGLLIDAGRLHKLVKEHNKEAEQMEHYPMTLDNCSMRNAFCFCCNNDTEFVDDVHSSVENTTTENENIQSEPTDVIVEINQPIDSQSTKTSYVNTSEEVSGSDDDH